MTGDFFSVEFGVNEGADDSANHSELHTKRANASALISARSAPQLHIPKSHPPHFTKG